MDVEQIDGVSVVRIDRPPANALDLELVQDAAALHRHARRAIEEFAEIDPGVRAGWLSDETFARIGQFLDGLR